MEVQYLKGVGPAFAKRLTALGIHSFQDLLYFFPYRYEDRTKVQTITDLPTHIEKDILLRVYVDEVDLLRPRPKLYIVKAHVHDSSGRSCCATWFNQKFLADTLKPGSEIVISGKVSFNSYEQKYEVVVEDYDFVRAQDPQRVVPFYHLTEGVYQKKLRLVMQTALEFVAEIKDPLPIGMRSKELLVGLSEAIKEMHFPTTRERWKAAHRRIVFDEFFYPQLAMAVRQRQCKTELKGIEFLPSGALMTAYQAALPYTLTGAQNKVIKEIFSDMASIRPMNRLVQGDVGSGKTDVALAAIVCAVQSGYQAVVMVPTEVLAEQHYRKMVQRLETIGVRVLSLLGKHTPKEKNLLYEKIANQDCDLIIGTQAVIQEKVKFAKLGLCIIDEQHRFGVVQRNLLKGKSSENVDLLVMTATPIPRTLSLTVYGDLDVSVIDELPPGRTPIKTYHIHPRDREKTYMLCQRELERGRQIYIVYPLVEESEKIDLKAAVESYEYLKTTAFKNYRVGLMHGRLSDQEKAAVMEAFRNHELDVMVSTTVIEVGIDVPNATIMLIEHAERFGLSQLHQLRGRVGRGTQASVCYLIAEIKNQTARERIKAMVDTTDGFIIAEVDLKLRGPGDYAGIRQSGFPELMVADFVKDEKVLQQARICARNIVERDPLLIQEDQYLIKKELFSRTRGLIEHILLN